jgi:hypothetical protein
VIEAGDKFSSNLATITAEAVVTMFNSEASNGMVLVIDRHVFPPGPL